jgi:hypothetical protein
MGCDGGVADASPVASPCQVSMQVSFAADVEPTLNGCTGEVCHAPWSYSSVVRVAASECCDGRLLVAPGDPGHSYLLDKLTNHDLCNGSPMPLDAYPVATATTKAIADWICAGALEN